MTRAYLAFTETGLALAKRLSAALPGSVARCGQDGVSLAEWTSAQFVQSDALIFVGAAGIAVRAIAPHCKSKTTDPAVVVVDECGRFAVPILSGHLGGANELALKTAEILEAIPVVTTATPIINPIDALNNPEITKMTKSAAIIIRITIVDTSGARLARLSCHKVINSTE